MKTSSPIKRHQALVSFSKDHHFGLLLVWKIRQGLKKAVSNERISNYVLYFFKEDLAKHFSDEEQMLFDQLPADDILRLRAEAEHKIIYDLVTSIDKKKDDAALLIRMADELEKHIRFEEREFFNHIQKIIPENELIEIAARFTNNSKAIDENWKDEFWNTSQKI
jgi:iron-sulfur cluster repair protein YtfE (RIC family)